MNLIFWKITGDIMKENIRNRILEYGADVCEFAGIERFAGAPAGFHPRDIWRDCETVIVFGIALPEGLFRVKPDLVYEHFNYLSCQPVDNIAFRSAKVIEEQYGGIAVPLPSDGPYEYWDKEKMEGRGLISMKHAAVCAGLGTLGKNTLLINKQFGNRLTLGAVLTNLKFQSDDPAEPLCIKSCRLCIENCPVHAFDGQSVTQKACRTYTYGTNSRGYDTVRCNTCRNICPMHLGKKAVIE